MTPDRAMLADMLRLKEPWAVRDWQFDAAKRRLDIHIGIEVPRGWFGRPKAMPLEAAPKTWRHLDVLGWRSFVHVHAPVNADLTGTPWTGAPEQPFTRTMARQIFNLLNEGVSLEAICTLCSVSLDELWRFKYALDNGRPVAQAVPTAQAPQAAAPQRAAATSASAPAAATPDTPEVPDVTDPVWMALINGHLNPDIRVLSFKLLLTRLRSQMDVITDDEVRMLKLRELHRYFVKNARMLVHELAQIRQMQP